MKHVYIVGIKWRQPVDKSLRHFARDFAHMFPRAAEQVQVTQLWDEDYNYVTGYDITTTSRSPTFLTLLQGYLMAIFGDELLTYVPGVPGRGT